ncbi:MAG: iron hydrogenase small subunit, partial [Candidatus Ornithomonoglobus sp.]
LLTAFPDLLLEGCSGGGGTPILFGDEGVRHRGLYKYDASCTVRSSHNNAVLDKIYSEYLAYPCSEKSEELLHTSYKERG